MILNPKVIINQKKRVLIGRTGENNLLNLRFDCSFAYQNE